MNKIHFQINELYLELAKGAFIRSRAKWLEEGERNSSYLFALEKRNGKRKSLSALNIDGAVCKDIVQISNFVIHFYSNLYSSKFDTNSCDSCLDKIRCCIPAIDEDYRSYCESGLKCEEVWKAFQSMKKGKSLSIDGLFVEFYTHVLDTIKSPLVKNYKECIIHGECHESGCHSTTWTFAPHYSCTSLLLRLQLPSFPALTTPTHHTIALITQLSPITHLP